jgi:hypothetical protein
MSLKKKMFGFPATVLGITFGLVIGGLAATKEVVQQKFPNVGLVIIVATPVLSFLFEQIMSRAFPEQYWEKLAGKLVKLYRHILNEDFHLRFVYTMRFLVTPDSPKDITAELICQTLKATPGGDPEPAFIGENYVHLRFSGSPFLVSVRWDLEESDDDATENGVTIFRITMEPQVLNLAMRRAKDDIEGTIARLRRLQESLLLLFKTPPETLAVADAWFSESRPPATPIPKARIDNVSGAEYQIFPGLLHVTGADLSALGAVYRYVGTLEPPPEPQ